MGSKSDGRPQNAHGRGSSWQIPNGNWRCRVQIDRVRITGSGKSERDARADMNRNLRALRREDQGRAQVAALVIPPIPLDLPAGREFVRQNDPVFRRWIYRRDGGICGICGQLVDFDAMHVDHIRPRIDGGNDHVSNFRISHGPCNLRRGSWRQQPVRV